MEDGRWRVEGRSMAASWISRGSGEDAGDSPENTYRPRGGEAGSTARGGIEEHRNDLQVLSREQGCKAARLQSNKAEHASAHSLPCSP
jgi:hypothetical protein